MHDPAAERPGLAPRAAGPDSPVAPAPPGAAGGLATPTRLSTDRSPTTFRSLRHRNYRLYFIGQLVSLCGTWMQAAALTWVSFRLTGTSSWPSVIAAAQVLPTSLFGVWGGALADRFPKRSILLVTQTVLLAQATALAVLVGSGRLDPWYLLGLALVSGLTQAFDFPSRLAFVGELVPRDDLMNAVALNSMIFNGARVIGPLLAGLVLVWLGASACFLGNALSYVAVLWALWAMRFAHQPPAGRSQREAGATLAALRYLLGHPELGSLAVLLAVVSVCGWPFMSLLPALADRILGHDERGYTLMLSASGFGALLASLVIATFGSLARSRRFIAAGLVGVVVGLIGLSWVTGLPAALGCCTLVGCGLILFNATSQSVVQMTCTEHNRGQIMGLWAVILSGGVPLGNLLAGPAADSQGVALCLRAQGVVCALAAGGVLGLRLLSRRGRSLSEPARGLHTGDP